MLVSLLSAQAEHSSVVKVQYDYDAAAHSELSLKEDQTLLVFGEEEDGWLLFQEKQGRLRSRELCRGRFPSYLHSLTHSSALIVAIRLLGCE